MTNCSSHWPSLEALKNQPCTVLKVVQATRRQQPNATRGGSFSSSREQMREVILKHFRRLSAARRKDLIQVWRRWEHWFRSHQASSLTTSEAWKPNPLELAMYLNQVSKGGPTAARGDYHALLWWSRKLGLPLPMESPLLTDFAMVAPGHTTKQAKELQAWVFLNLLVLARNLSGVTTWQRRFSW